MRFYDVPGSFSEPLLTQNRHRRCVLARMSFFSSLLFVFLKGPTLDPLVPAQSKRVSLLFEPVSNNVRFSHESPEYF